MPKPKRLERFTFNHFKKDLRLLFSYKLTYFILLVLVLLIFSPFLVVAVLKVKPAENIEYGVTFSSPYTRELGLDTRATYLAILDELKVDNLRLVLYWNEIEDKKGEYNFSDVTWQVEEAQKRNVDVVLVVGKKVPRWPECHEPKWVKDLSEEDAEKALLTLVAKEVEHFRKYDNIKFWQVENEPYFPFGHCEFPRWAFLKEEVALVRSLDDQSRPIIVQDSGEGGLWAPTYSLGDYLGISMYRRIWYDFWGIFLGKRIFFTYPLSYWSYPLKAKVTNVPLDKVMVLELQAEPWGDGPIPTLSEEIKGKTMSYDKYLETLSYAQKTGISSFYLWGAEWWYWEKEVNGNPEYWETAKALWK